MILQHEAVEWIGLVMLYCPALQVMDTDKDKYISFEEFAKWWGAKKSKAMA
jgi:hypothetical protein